LTDGRPAIQRSVVRLVVLDPENRVLLLLVREPAHPEQGTCWELPGGGIEVGETYLEAAVRELHEETGILARPADVGLPSWRRRATFLHAGTRRLQNEVVVSVRVPGPTVDAAGQLDDEKAIYHGFRWWPVADIEASTERFYPGRLPVLLRRFLAGEQIDEPFEFFS
jgi:8-oxo-dGTP pyrophosphatase MutT (NUDIX family)